VKQISTSTILQNTANTVFVLTTKRRVGLVQQVTLKDCHFGRVWQSQVHKHNVLFPIQHSGGSERAPCATVSVPAIVSSLPLLPQPATLLHGTFPGILSNNYCI